MSCDARRLAVTIVTANGHEPAKPIWLMECVVEFLTEGSRMQPIQSNHLFARATSGSRLDICYDAQTNALVFVEDDWSADVRGGALPRSAFREQLDTPRVKRLPRRRAG